MAAPSDETPEQDNPRTADTRHAMELGLPPARGTTAGQDRPDAGTAERGASDGRTPGDTGDGRSSGATTAGGGAPAGGAASGAAAAAAWPPPGEVVKKTAEEAAEKAKASLESYNTAEAIWSVSQGPQGSPPEHRRRSGGARPPGQATDRSGPGNRGPGR